MTQHPPVSSNHMAVRFATAYYTAFEQLRPSVRVMQFMKLCFLSTTCMSEHAHHLMHRGPLVDWSGHFSIKLTLQDLLMPEHPISSTNNKYTECRYAGAILVRGTTSTSKVVNAWREIWRVDRTWLAMPLVYNTPECKTWLDTCQVCRTWLVNSQLRRTSLKHWQACQVSPFLNRKDSNIVGYLFGGKKRSQNRLIFDDATNVDNSPISWHGGNSFVVALFQSTSWRSKWMPSALSLPKVVRKNLRFGLVHVVAFIQRPWNGTDVTSTNKVPSREIFHHNKIPENLLVNPVNHYVADVMWRGVGECNRSKRTWYVKHLFVVLSSYRIKYDS